MFQGYQLQPNESYILRKQFPTGQTSEASEEDVGLGFATVAMTITRLRTGINKDEMGRKLKARPREKINKQTCFYDPCHAGGK